MSTKKKPAKAAKKVAPKKVAKVAKAPVKAGTKNGVVYPKEGSIGAQLFDIANKLREKLGRPPARFEFREAVDKENQKWAKADQYSENSISFAYFRWRKYYGIKARATNLYPKWNSFETSSNERRAASPKPAKKAAKKVAKPAKKVVKPAAKKATPAKKAVSKASAPASPKKKVAPKASAAHGGKVKAVVAKKAPQKTPAVASAAKKIPIKKIPAKKAAAPWQKPATTATEAPAVSSRLAATSAAAADTPADTTEA